MTGRGGRRLIAVKGAPEAVLGLCATQLDAGGQRVALDAESYLSAAQGFARAGTAHARFRLQGGRRRPCRPAARRSERPDLRRAPGHDRPAQDLEAIAAVAECQSAGIRVVMITGDHPDTAQAVGCAARHPRPSAS
ncbi:MAG: hypothetical protein MZV65_02785 [Chromatiales bacterium]|nr:hypothetical protein [Chromatiales bacterium]